MFIKLLKILILFLFTETIIIAQPFGIEWQILQSPTENTLRKLHFIDGRTGWAAGAAGTIIHTTEGGDNWIVNDFPVVNAIMNTIFFFDSLNGFIGGKYIASTSDGGNTWIEAK